MRWMVALSLLPRKLTWQYRISSSRKVNLAIPLDLSDLAQLIYQYPGDHYNVFDQSVNSYALFSGSSKEKLVP